MDGITLSDNWYHQTLVRHIPEYIGPMGERPQEPDSRDHEFEKYAFDRGVLARATSLPKSVLLYKRDKPWPIPVYEQITIGSCTAQTGAFEYEYLTWKAGGPQLRVSRLQLYRNARIDLGGITWANMDTGATGRSIARVLAKIGGCPEHLWPYVESRYREAPPASCVEASDEHQLLEYLAIPQQTADTGRLIKTSLYEGYPVGFGVDLHVNFKPDQWGRIPMPSGQKIGGHRMAITGFSDYTRRYQVRNSWSDTWGRDGYCAIPYEYIDQMGRDFWTFRKTEG